MHAANELYMELHTDNSNFNPSQNLSSHPETLGYVASDDTDDDQEDLPFDGILECYLVPNLDCNGGKQSGSLSASHHSETSLTESQHINSENEAVTDEAFHSEYSADIFGLSEADSSNKAEVHEGKEHESERLTAIPTIIPDVLLRHFADDCLLNPCEFIDYETMPEISIAESSSETVISRTSYAKPRQCDFEEEQLEEFEDEYLEMHQNENTEVQEEMSDSENTSDAEGQSSKDDVEGHGPELIEEGMGLNELPFDNVDNDGQYIKYDPGRRPSHEVKYGQGQVHYKLPDFSKVPPKVKIPKSDLSPVKRVSTFKRTTSSPNLMGQSFAIQDILDSMQPLMQQEQWDMVSRDPISTSNFSKNGLYPPSSECFPADSFQSIKRIDNESEVISPRLRTEDALQTSDSPGSIKDTKTLDGAKVPTEGEKMSTVLMEQAQKLKMKTFQNLKSCLESLELNYINTKGKHRDLQLQIYRTGSQTVGEFDIEREVEGQIFRLGMLLEDIQEQINQNEESITQQEALLSPFPEEEQEDTILLQCLGSLNSPAASQTQMPLHDFPLVMEDTNSSHIQNCHQSSITCTDIKENSSETDAKDKHQSMTVSLIQSAGRDSSGISQSSAKPVHVKLSHISQWEHPADCHLSENSFCVKRKQKSKNVKEDLLNPNRCQEWEIRKHQRKFLKQEAFSMFIQEKAVNLDYPDYDESEADSSCSVWTTSSHDELSQYSIKSTSNGRAYFTKASARKTYSNGSLSSGSLSCKWLNSDTDIKELHKQKSFWTSKLPVYAEKQSYLSSSKNNKVNYSKLSSRPNVKPLVLHFPHLSDPVISNLQRKSWVRVKQKSQDYIDNKILNFVLDKALRTAQNMQRTTERMAQQLATDLVNRSHYGSSYSFWNKKDLRNSFHDQCSI